MKNSWRDPVSYQKGAQQVYPFAVLQIFGTDE
jgi:hypothetical protein